jgi:MFS transporter, DHA3 family, multidrug efflux protein
MDSYGLSIMSVQAWGIALALLGTGFILGGFLVSKFGLGKSVVKTLLIINAISWLSATVFTIHAGVATYLIGIFVWMTLGPIAEAAEATILQKLIPLERQGRVIGFAQTIEQMASPITALLIGPITQFLVIPFMTDGLGARMIGSWFGTGSTRAIALVFTIAGIIGLCATLLAYMSTSFKKLEQEYLKS